MARPNIATSNFADCLTIGEAASVLGVSPATLRNWDRSGKLKPRRHPQNGYRIYLHEDLAAVLRSAELATLDDESFVPQVNWTKVSDSEHFVQFYESEAFLIESASGFLGAALREENIGIVALTPEHQVQLEQKLVADGIDVAAAKADGRYVAYNALDLLPRFMVGDMPDAARFHDLIGRTVAELAARGRRIHAFGEMVTLLWAEGNRSGAIALEQLWNDLAKQHRFALMCAYAIDGFGGADHAAAFDEVCSCHSRVIPADDYAAADSENERLRAVSSLQQRLCSLQAEVEHRRGIESLLRRQIEQLTLPTA